jgi:SHS family lactate transporter-like MFS transporter
MSQIKSALSTAAAQLEYTSTERSLVVVFAFLATLFDGADFFIFTYFLIPIAKYYGISLVSVTVIQAISYLSGIVGGLLFGTLADRWGRRMGLALTVAMYSIFTFASGFANDFNTLLILRALAGIGIGGESGIAFAYLNEAFHGGKNHRGLFCGAMQTMFIFGGLASAMLFHFTSVVYGREAWRWAFGYLGLVVLLAVAILKFMPESKLWLASRNQKKAGIPIVDIFRKGMGRTTLWGTVLMTFGFFGCYAILTFAPTLWTSAYGFSAPSVAKLNYVGNTLAIIAYLVGGWLADVLGRKNSFTLTALVGTIGYLFFLVVAVIFKLPAHEATVWTSLPFFGFVLMELGYGYFGVQGSWLSELYPTYARTTGQNFVYYVSRAIGAGIAPLLALSIAVRMGFDVRMAISLGVIGSVMTMVVSRLLPETRGTELRNE